MNKQEYIIIAFCALVLAAVVIWRNSLPFGAPELSASQDDITQAETKQGPAWLVYNSPWGFNPATGNVLPSRSIGQLGQVGQAGSAQSFADFPYADDCGCS